MKNVIIYTTPTCVYCKMAKAFFKEKNIQYQEIDVAADPKAADEMVEKSGQMGVPVIEVDDEMVVGFNQERLSQLFELS